MENKINTFWLTACLLIMLIAPLFGRCQDTMLIDGHIISEHTTIQGNLTPFYLQANGSWYNTNPFNEQLRIKKLKYQVLREGRIIGETDYVVGDSMISYLEKIGTIDSLNNNYSIRNNLCLGSEVEKILFYSEDKSEAILSVSFYDFLYCEKFFCDEHSSKCILFGILESTRRKPNLSDDKKSGN